MRYYETMVHKEADTAFGISFPDFPGCISAGCTLGEAVAMGAEALAGHIELMSDEGLPVPEPSSLDAVMADPEAEGGVPVMVPALVKKPVRAVRANITVPEDILAKIDAFAESLGMSRSGFLTHAAQRQMEDN